MLKFVLLELKDFGKFHFISIKSWRSALMRGCYKRGYEGFLTHGRKASGIVVLRHHPQRHLRTDCHLATALDCIYPHVRRRKCPTESSALDRTSHVYHHILCLPKLPTKSIRYKGCRENRHECGCSKDG